MWSSSFLNWINRFWRYWTSCARNSCCASIGLTNLHIRKVKCVSRWDSIRMNINDAIRSGAHLIGCIIWRTERDFWSRATPTSVVHCYEALTSVIHNISSWIIMQYNMDKCCIWGIRVKCDFLKVEKWVWKITVQLDYFSSIQVE